MDLDRGQCFCCNANKILLHEKPDVCEKLFIHLFGEVDFKDVKEKLLLLKWCPLCFQKLLIVLNNLDKFENLKSDSEDDKCVICRKKQYLVNIEKLPHIVKNLEDLGQKDIKQLCLHCLYILDSRHTIKEKIFSKHPQLRVRRRKTQASTNYSSPVTKRSKRILSQVIELSDNEESVTSAITNISIFKKLKPLKYDKFLGNLKVIHGDPKFYAQIPYTRLQIYSTQNNLKQKSKHETAISADEDDSPKKNMFFKIKFKSHNNKYSIVKNKSISSKPKSKSVSFYCEEDELKKHNISSSLIVNLNKSTDKSFNFSSDDSRMDTDAVTSEDETVESKEVIDSDDEKSVTLENKIDSKEEKFFASRNESSEMSILIQSDEEIESEENTENKNLSQETLVIESGEEPELAKSGTARHKEESNKQWEENRGEQSENVDDESERKTKDNKEDLTETKADSKPKRSRPKPLSKQKKNKVQEDVEEIPKTEEKKKYKPGPLSKKKRRESKCIVLSDDESKTVDESNNAYNSKNVDDQIDADETKEIIAEENDNLNQNDEADDKNENSTEKPEDTTIEIITEEEETDKTEGKENVVRTENKDDSQEDKGKDEEDTTVAENSNEEENGVERDDNTNDTTIEDAEVVEENVEKVSNEDKESQTNDTNAETTDDLNDKTNETDKDEKLVDPKEVENDKNAVEVTNGNINEINNANDENEQSDGKDNDNKLNLEFVDSSSEEDKISSVKRKCDDEKIEGIVPPDKKKKRVTFSEILESSFE